MGVAPETIGCTTAQIFISHVQPANKTRRSVNDDNFSVIPVIYPAGQRQETHFTINADLHTCFFQLSDKGFRQANAADGIKHKADFNPRLRFLHQRLLDFPADIIGPVNIIFHMYVMFSLLQFLKQGREGFFSIRQHLRPSCHRKRRSCQTL
ncbi:hypothetical protein D3C77_575830 [compost metagenome]